MTPVDTNRVPLRMVETLLGSASVANPTKA